MVFKRETGGKKNKYGKKSSLGFGAKAIRFNIYGTHPQWRRTITHRFASTSRFVGPANYHPQLGDFDPPTINRKMKAPNWKRMEILSEFGKWPNIFIREAEERRLNELKERYKVLSSDFYVPKTFIQKLEEKPRSNKAYIIPAGPRFRKSVTVPTPGPGFYGLDHVPQKRIEVAADNRRAKNTLFRNVSYGSKYLPGCRLGPETYKIKPEIDLFLNKKVGSKGPYQVFTGPRDDTTLYGYQRKDQSEGSANFYLKLDNTLERLNNKNNLLKGKWFTNRKGRFHIPEKEDPEPFYPEERHCLKPAFFAPFNSTSAKRFVSDEHSTAKVGAGRYNPKFFIDDPIYHSYKSSFKVKKEASEDVKSLFRGIMRERNLHYTERRNYEPTQTGKDHIIMSHLLSRKSIF